jgi:uncharacterized membrane protein
LSETEAQPQGSRPSQSLALASTLAWLLGALDLVGAAVISVPLIAAGMMPLIPLGLAVLGALSCTAGYLLRKRRRLGGIIALGLAAFSIVSRALNGSLLSVEFAVVLAMLVLVLVAWKELR